VSIASIPALREGDLVAVRLEPGPVWPGLVERVWEAGAALFPIDHRLQPPEVNELMIRACPTVVIDGGGATRLEDGVGVDPGVAIVVATSGTAGVPKLVQLARSAVERAVGGSALALEANPGEGWLCCLPLGHVGGLLVLLRSSLLGAPVTLHARFDPAAVARSPEVRFVSLVPTMLGRLLEEEVNLRHFRAILVGGDALPEDMRRSAERSGARIVQTYGLAESCGGVIYDGVPLPDVRVRIGDEGDIQLGGPTLMLGYRFDPGGTAGAFAEDGWLRTADAGGIVDGRLRVTGRMDDVIVTGGEKVWPEEVESVLRDHPKVADVAIAGRADPVWGSRVVAFVVPADSGSPLRLEELRAHAAGRLPGFRAPRELVVVAGLPRSPLGKLRRKRLPI
jgi:o-succinylbenzoate---CoA ligase